MTTPSPDTTPERVPERVPSGSQMAPEASANRVGPRVPLSPIGDPLSEPSRVGPTSGSGHPNFNPGTVWLITPRTRDAWTAALDLLDDNEPHDLLDLRQVMHDTGDLAHRTITNHLRSASRRGWITLRRGKVRLRDRGLIETALDALDGVA